MALTSTRLQSVRSIGKTTHSLYSSTRRSFPYGLLSDSKEGFLYSRMSESGCAMHDRSMYWCLAVVELLVVRYEAVLCLSSSI